jgi:hypothetical protein
VAVQGGLGSSLLIGAESTTGTAVTLTRSLEYNSESLHLEKGITQGEGLRGSGLFARNARRAYTTRTANGSIELDVATKGMGLLFQQICGGTSTSAVVTGSAYQQVHQPGSMVNRSLTIQKLVPRMSDGTLVPLTYRGCKFTGWEFNCEVGGIVTLTVDVDGWDETTGTAAGTPSYPATEVFHFAQGVLVLGGTPSTTSGVVSISGGTTVASVKGATVRGDTPLKTDRFFFGSAGIKAEQTENGWRTIGGSFDAEFVTAAALYDTMAADTAVAMKLTFTGTTAITGSTYPTLELLIPAIRLDAGSPQIDGPDVINLSTDFVGLDNAVDAAMQIRYVTSDTSVS